MKSLKNKKLNSDLKDKIRLLRKNRTNDDLSAFYRQINDLGIDITPLDNKQAVMNKNGILVHSPKEILEVWKTHFSDLLSCLGQSKTKENATEMLLQYGMDKSLGDEPSIREIEEALRCLKNRKATGEDMIPIEILKSFDSDSEAKKHLHRFICEYWTAGDVPQDWKDAVIIILFKKGSKTDCNNYRGIALMSHIGKILCKILATRLQEYAETLGILPEQQSGFREERSCRDQIYSLRRIQEMSLEQNKPLYICFVDLKKAYDSVDRETLWKVLKKFGVNEKMIQMIRAFHDGMKAKININGEFSEAFPINQGLRQGCVMATVLFNIFFAAIFREMERKLKQRKNGNVGIKINTNFHIDPTNKKYRTLFKEQGNLEETIEWFLSSLLFADDAAFPASTVEDLQLICDTFDETCSEFGLSVSIPKTKILVQWDKESIKNKQTHPTIVTLGGEKLEEVDSFKYLGVITAKNGSWEEEFLHRKRLAWAQFLEQRQTIYQRFGLALRHKIWLFKTYITTKLLYGCEAWAPTAKEFSQIEEIQRTMLMMILGIRKSDKVSYVEILEKAKMLSVESYIRKQRLLWAGHIARMKDDRIPKLLFFGTIDGGQNSKGGRKLTLRDAVYHDLIYFNIEKSKWIDLAKKGKNDWIATVSVGQCYFDNCWKLRKPEQKARDLFRQLPLNPSNKEWPKDGEKNKYSDKHTPYNYFADLESEYLQYTET